MSGEDWACDAYGPGGNAVDARCFFAEPGDRSCGTQDECRTRLAAERTRVFNRIHELAADFTDPGQLLGDTAAPADEELGVVCHDVTGTYSRPLDGETVTVLPCWA